VVGASLLGAAERLDGDVDTRPALLLMLVLVLVLVLVLMLNEAVRSRIVRELVFDRRRPD
jgi:hypothetical protein